MIGIITRAESIFSSGGPFFHLYTEPVEDDLLIQSVQDYIVFNNLIAVASFECGARILAFAIMSNHLHIVLENDLECNMLFFSVLKRRLRRYYSRHGRGGAIRKMNSGYTRIDNLKQLRDVIIYVIRNPFVIREDVNPLSYRWCSGYLYFNSFLDTGGRPASELSIRERYRVTFSKTGVHLSPRMLVRDAVVNPVSFVDYRRVMSFFDNARQFLFWVFKNVEGQVETARRLGEMPFLNDEELLSLTFKLCRSVFGVKSPRDLQPEKRRQLALKLKNESGASNGQVARCTNLPLKEVNALFPLSAKR